MWKKGRRWVWEEEELVEETERKRIIKNKVNEENELGGRRRSLKK